MSQQTINFGIDLGTTNSAIAKYNNGEVIIFKNPLTIKETIPSVVAFKGDRLIVGDKANELLSRKPQNVFGTFKRKMGTSDRFYLSDKDTFYSPIELSAIILKELKKFIHTGEKPRSIVITIPAAFDTVQSNATKQAGLDAGFEEVVLLQEPIAASLAYANSTSIDLNDGKWLVYDLGGGTFDVAIATAKDGEMKVLDHEGDNYLGGSDFDQLIVENFIVPEIERKGDFCDLLLNLKTGKGRFNGVMHKLMLIAEEAKKTLTSSQAAEIEFELEDDNGKELDIYFEVTLKMFENLITPSINRTISMIDEMLDRNLLGQDQIKHILLIGGSTYIPLVRKMLESHYMLDINTEMDPTTSVVRGAAYYAGLKVSKLEPKEDIDFPAKESSIDSVKIAYERVTSDDRSTVMITSDLKDSFFRITREDGGYDSGLILLKEEQFEVLPLISDRNNSFKLEVSNHLGEINDIQSINISHGKFNIDGQPLPNSICIEIDSIKENTTYLEPIFLKNSILPLKKTITKQVSKTITKNSDESVFIKVFEGTVDSLPAANRLVGLIKISGSDLERDLVKGSDIDLTFEISESRDITVSAYLVLTDQEFVNTFSPVEVLINQEILIKELSVFRRNLNRFIRRFENENRFEQAAQVKYMLNDIDNLENEINDLNENDKTDRKYQLELKKREIGEKIYKNYTSSFLTAATQKYFELKQKTQEVIESEYGNNDDKLLYENILNEERAVLKDGNITNINRLIDRLESLCNKIVNRRKITSSDIVMYYSYYSHLDYGENQDKADELIEQGKNAVTESNDNVLIFVVNKLASLLDKDSDNNVFKTDSTGLK